jgi:DNA-binding SARP family transcriptional activator
VSGTVAPSSSTPGSLREGYPARAFANGCVGESNSLAGLRFPCGDRIVRNQLEAQLFGTLTVSRNGTPLPPFPSRNSASLFAFLAMHQGRCLERDVVCGTLWSECGEAGARKRLRTALWHLRAFFSAHGTDPDAFLQVEGVRLLLRADGPVRVDVSEFDELTRSVTRPPPWATAIAEAAELGRAVDLYRADLLDGVYEEWCFFDRERLRLSFLTALERLVAHHFERAEWSEAIGRADQLLRHDPLRENVHRVAMQCHVARGNRPSAIRQYRRCAELLAAELDIEPIPETTALYESILGARPGPASTPSVAGGYSRPRSTV